MKLPNYAFLILASLMLGLAPFVPEPHLVEKVRWLFTGHPFKPIDIFDLFLHGTFPALLLIKAGQDALRLGKSNGAGGTEGSDSQSPEETTKTRAKRRQEKRERKKG